MAKSISKSMEAENSDSKKTQQKGQTKKKSMSKKDSALVKYFVIGLIATVVIFFFSMFMAIVAESRRGVARDNFMDTAAIYNGELRQAAPSANNLQFDTDKNVFMGVVTEEEYSDRQVLQKRLETFAKSANVIKTNATIELNADFVKKGLEYQPAFSTKFKATYILKNSLDENSAVAFEFPFPYNVRNGEISNVSLVVAGEEVQNPKAQVQDPKAGEYAKNPTVDGLVWKGELEPLEEVEIEVSYDTVGLSRVYYEGMENNLGSQDFALELIITGTRSYDVKSGLSVDERIFGENGVTLVWNKVNLFSSPVVNVTIADKIAPSSQVSRIYLAMAPIYAIFIGIFIWAGFRKNNLLRVKDMLILTVLYVIYFPLLHYLTSFTIDPTIQSLSGFANVGFFSMPLYGAFGLALLLVGGLIVYLIKAAYGTGHALKAALPTVLMFLGFFPLVITIPEYSMLLVLIGSVILVALFIQARLGEAKA